MRHNHEISCLAHPNVFQQGVTEHLLSAGYFVWSWGCICELEFYPLVEKAGTQCGFSKRGEGKVDTKYHC